MNKLQKDIYLKNFIRKNKHLISKKINIDYKILSWNVNSIRSRIFNNFTLTELKKNKIKTISPSENSPISNILQNHNPDIMCFQETKLTAGEETNISIPGYNSYYNTSSKKGYSGVAVFSKEKAINVITRIDGVPEHLLDEGRILVCFYEDLVVINMYVPNTLRGDNDISYIENRILFDQAINSYIQKLNQTHKNIIVTGDFNVARSLTDIYFGAFSDEMELNDNGKINNSRKHKALKLDEEGGGAGFRLSERIEFEKYITNSKLIDVWRHLYNDYGFTFWHYMCGKERFSGGWRIDYFLVTKYINILDMKILKNIDTHNQTLSSDHVPIIFNYTY